MIWTENLLNNSEISKLLKELRESLACNFDNEQIERLNASLQQFGSALKNVTENIYLQFLIVFPEIKKFISDYNKKYKIINLIHSMRMKGKRYTFYQLFTNNFSNFKQLRCKDLIAIFNFLFIQYITDINKYINSLSELENIIKALFEMLKEITKEN